MIDFHCHLDLFPNPSKIVKGCLERGLYVLEYLEKYPNAGVPILHWYSGNIKDLRRALDLGCWFSVNPVMAKSKSGIRVIQSIPKNRLLTETDGPFTGNNGRPYMSWDVQIVIQFLSEIWGVPIETSKEIVWENSFELLETSLVDVNSLLFSFSI